VKLLALKEEESRIILGHAKNLINGKGVNLLYLVKVNYGNILTSKNKFKKKIVIDFH